MLLRRAVAVRQSRSGCGFISLETVGNHWRTSLAHLLKPNIVFLR